MECRNCGHIYSQPGHGIFCEPDCEQVWQSRELGRLEDENAELWRRVKELEKLLSKAATALRRKEVQILTLAAERDAAREELSHCRRLT